MININDVDCKCLINRDNQWVEQTRFVKEHWNGMDEEKRSGYWTTEASHIGLDARALLGYVYERVEQGYYYDDDCYDKLFEQLWANTPDDVVERLQKILDEICKRNAYIVLKTREKIDPTIDLEDEE
jgi:hypothetical protein